MVSRQNLHLTDMEFKLEQLIANSFSSEVTGLFNLVLCASILA